MPVSSPWNSGNPLFPGTSDLPYQPPIPPNGPFFPHLKVRGVWFPSPRELLAKPQRTWWLRAVVQCRHAGVTPGWCPRQGTTHQTMTSMRRLSSGLIIKSATDWCDVQQRAHTHSSHFFCAFQLTPAPTMSGQTVHWLWPMHSTKSNKLDCK